MELVNHVTHHTFYGSQELGQLQCLDYNKAFLSQIPYQSVRVSGEQESHREALAQSLTTEGVRMPLIVLQRKCEALVLVEGHHRGAFSYENNLKAPVELHKCACAPEKLDYFGLCPTILESCKQQRYLSERLGWSGQ